MTFQFDTHDGIPGGIGDKFIGLVMSAALYIGGWVDSQGYVVNTFRYHPTCTADEAKRRAFRMADTLMSATGAHITYEEVDT